MASGFYNRGLKNLLDGTFNLGSTTFKVMLVKNSYTYDPDHNFVNQTSEIAATNYTAGFGGAGRKTATVTSQQNDTNNRVDIAIADLTWTALGGGVNDTVGGAALIKEGTTDADSVLIAFFDLTDTGTNGSDFTLDFLAIGSGGNLRISV